MIQIKHIKILGLFGNRDITIDLSSGKLILVGENGLGKTTILSILNHLLSGRIEDLSGYRFECIEVLFTDYGNFSLPISEIREYANSFRHIAERSSYSNMRFLVSYLVSEDFDYSSKEAITKTIESRPERYNGLGRYDRESDAELTEAYISHIQLFSNIYLFRRCIRRMRMTVLYLPTYRRIEASARDIFNQYQRRNHLSIKDRFKLREGYWETFDNPENWLETIERHNILHFGMKDIEGLIESLQNRISRKSVSGYAEMSGKMISKLLEKGGEEGIVEVKDTDHIKVVLQRIGDAISDSERESIIRLIEEGRFNDNHYLSYLFDSLIEVYKSTEKYDEAMRGFRDACNRFLINKKFRYDESKVTLSLHQETDGKPGDSISLDKLSSGEKQIVSLMATAYLEISKRLLFIIDEPELSISVYWQKALLPTLLEAPSCVGLIAATHSPFIFDNPLKKFAKGTPEYVRFNR